MPLITRDHVILIVKFIVFQIGWFAAVLGGAHDYVFGGSLLVAAIVAVHIWQASIPSREVLLILFTTLIGTIWDSALVALNVIQYPHGIFISGVAPIWIIAVWALFATAFNTTLTYFKHRYVFASLFGAIGAPLSFLAGMRLGALQFPNQTMALIVIGAGWATMMPMLMKLAQRYDGYDAVR